MYIKQTGPTQEIETLTVTQWEDGLADINFVFDDRISSENYLISTGVHTPHFKARQLRGELMQFTFWEQFAFASEFTGELNITATRTSDNHQKGLTTVGAWGSPQVGYGNGPNWASEAKYGELKLLVDALGGDDYLIQQAAASIADQGWDVLTFTAELGKTRTLFSKVAVKLGNLRKLFRPRRARELYNDYLQAYKLWLEGRYGWRTLIYDLDDLYEAVNRIGKVMPDRQSRSLVGPRIANEDITNYPEDVANWMFTFDVTDTEVYEVEKVGRVAGDIKFDSLQTNLLVTGWELVPFSFVADWVISIGKAISAASFIANATDHTSSIGYKVTRNFTQVKEVVPKPGDGTWTFEGSGYIQWMYESSMVIRVPKPIPVVPQFRLNIDGMKIIDLIALIHQSVPRI